MRIAVIGMVLLLSPVVAQAKPDAGGHYIIMGQGQKSCGEWKTDREQKNWEAAVFTVWLAGYITAYDAWSAGPSDITSGTDLEGVAIRSWRCCSLCGEPHPR
jgi:hypothetical protein